MSNKGKMIFSSAQNPRSWYPNADIDGDVITFITDADAKKAEVLFNTLQNELAALQEESRQWDKTSLVAILARAEKAERELAEKEAALATHSGCPCLYTVPCHRDCSCVNPFMSRGCLRCASYGSSEQQRAMAEHLAIKIDASLPEPAKQDGK